MSAPYFEMPESTIDPQEMHRILNEVIAEKASNAIMASTSAAPMAVTSNTAGFSSQLVAAPTTGGSPFWGNPTSTYSWTPICALCLVQGQNMIAVTIIEGTAMCDVCAIQSLNIIHED